MNKIRQSTVAFLVAATLIAATSPTVGRAEDADAPKWTPVFQGIDMATWEVAEPLQKIIAARVDLRAEGIELKTTPPNKDFKPDERETWRQTTPEFLRTEGLAIAVNGNYYTPFNADTIVNPGDANLRGLGVSDGFVESMPEPGFPSFALYKNGDVAIREFAVDDDLSDVQQAVSGPMTVLLAGEVLPQTDDAIHPRTGIGYSQDKRYVYFITIDGRRPGFSVGATYADVGKALKRCGAYDGLNLDGGGSTTFVVRDPDDAPVVLNRPCNERLVKSGLRQNGNGIGVKAVGKPLTDVHAIVPF